MINCEKDAELVGRGFFVCWFACVFALIYLLIFLFVLFLYYYLMFCCILIKFQWKIVLEKEGKKKKKKEKDKKQGTYATISFEQICSSSPAAILKMMLPHMCFPLDFANFFFSTHLWTTASAFGRPFPSVRFRKGVITLEYLFFQLK